MARKSLKDFDKAMEKKYKKMDDPGIKKGDEIPVYKVVPMFLNGQNHVAGNGGLPLGKIYISHGGKSSGKTAVAIQMLASFQKNIKFAGKVDSDGDLIEYGNVGLIDAERSFNKGWYEKLGLDTSEDCFRLVTPPNGEVGLEIVEEMVKSGLYDAILVDSITALMPKEMLENDMGDKSMGAQARLFSKAYGRLKGLVDDYEVALIFISQERNTMNMYDPIAKTGGKATDFYSDITFKCSRSAWLGPKEEPLGITVKMVGDKNKVGIVKRHAEVDLYFKTGFDTYSDYVRFGVRHNIIEKSGAWYTIPGEEGKLQGESSVADYYREHKEAFDKLVPEVIRRTRIEDYEARGIMLPEDLVTKKEPTEEVVEKKTKRNKEKKEDGE